MSEHKEPIPSMIYNAAVGGHLTTSKQIIDENENKEQSQINAEVKKALGTGGSVDNRIAEEGAKHYLKEETYSKNELNNMITTPNQEYVSFIATAETTAVTDILPNIGAADTTYRVGNWDGTKYNDSVFSEYAWNGSAYIKLSTKSQIGEIYDISANHADTKYANLADALGTKGNNIPPALRRGGMSIKFVQSSDNKYVQYRYTGTSTAYFTYVVNWEKQVAETQVFGSTFSQQSYRQEYKMFAGHTYKIENISSSIGDVYCSSTKDSEQVKIAELTARETVLYKAEFNSNYIYLSQIDGFEINICDMKSIPGNRFDINKIYNELGEFKPVIEGKCLRTIDGGERNNKDWCYTTDYYPITLIENQQFRFYYGKKDPDGRAAIVFYDSDKNYVNSWGCLSDDYDSREFTVSSSLASSTSYFRMSFRIDYKLYAKITIDGVTIWEELPHNTMKSQIGRVENEIINLRLATYNTGDFTGIGFVKHSKEGKEAYRNAIGNIKANYIGFQYDVVNVGINPPADYYGNARNCKQVGTSDYNYYALAGDKFITANTVNYTPMTLPYTHSLFSVFVVPIYIDKKMLIINIHFEWKDNDLRAQQIADVLTYVTTHKSEYEYIVVMGDFNPEDYINGERQSSNLTYEYDLQKFKDVGFDCANAGYLGVFNTLASHREKLCPFDNILTLGNISIKNVGIIDKAYMNDHFPFYADVVLY